MYSVEYIPENDKHDCWNQHALTTRWTAGMLALFELRMNLFGSRPKMRSRLRKV